MNQQGQFPVTISTRNTKLGLQVSSSVEMKHNHANGEGGQHTLAKNANEYMSVGKTEKQSKMLKKKQGTKNSKPKINTSISNE